MRKFQKKPELLFITIPGHGRISDNRVLEGEHFARFVPSLLTELEPSVPAETIQLPEDPAPAEVLLETPAAANPVDPIALMPVAPVVAAPLDETGSPLREEPVIDPENRVVPEEVLAGDQLPPPETTEASDAAEASDTDDTEAASDDSKKKKSKKRK